MEKMKKEKQIGNADWRDKTAARIAGKIIGLQACFIRRLQKLEHRLTVWQKKVILLALCTVGSAYFLYLLGDALSSHPAGHYPRGLIQVRENGKSPPDTIIKINKKPTISMHN